MNNNDIFKKLRVALQLRDDQIVDILELVDFRMSKGEVGNVFRKEDHPNYMECGDQLLRNFLNGLVIHLRGTKENPKNPSEVIAGHKPKTEYIAKDFANSKPEYKPKTEYKKKPASNAKSRDQRTAPKVQIVEKVKFSNGNKKKS
jgi:hypothetical protein